MTRRLLRGISSTRLSDELENSDDEADDVPPLEEADNVNTIAPNGQRRVRGRTMMADVWAMNSGEQIVVESNGMDQPIGNEGGLLSGFLGTIARNGQHIPLDLPSWRDFRGTLQQAVMKIVKDKFDLHVSDRYVRTSLGKKWRDFKHELKRKNFKPEYTIDHVKNHVPDGVISTQYTTLLDMWFTREWQVELRERIRAEEAKPGTSGSTSREVQDKIFDELFGIDKYGRVRGLGLGVTRTPYYGPSASQRPRSRYVNVLRERVQQMEDERRREQERVQQMEEDRRREQELLESERNRMNLELARIERERAEDRAQIAEMMRLIANLHAPPS